MTDATNDDPGGPVPVRDLMRKLSGEPEVEQEPEWEGVERGFETQDGAWVVRTAGEGLYGTGRRGTARLVAVHFYRESDPDTPVRESLVPVGAFPHLQPEELRALFDRATPIDLDR